MPGELFPNFHLFLDVLCQLHLARFREAPIHADLPSLARIMLYIEEKRKEKNVKKYGAEIIDGVWCVVENATGRIEREGGLDDEPGAEDRAWALADE
jgi:hypothetical protein